MSHECRRNYNILDSTITLVPHQVDIFFSKSLIIKKCTFLILKQNIFFVYA